MCLSFGNQLPVGQFLAVAAERFWGPGIWLRGLGLVLCIQEQCLGHLVVPEIPSLCPPVLSTEGVWPLGPTANVYPYCMVLPSSGDPNSHTLYGHSLPVPMPPVLWVCVPLPRTWTSFSFPVCRAAFPAINSLSSVLSGGPSSPSSSPSIPGCSRFSYCLFPKKGPSEGWRILVKKKAYVRNRHTHCSFRAPHPGLRVGWHQP